MWNIIRNTRARGTTGNEKTTTDVSWGVCVSYLEFCGEERCLFCVNLDKERFQVVTGDNREVLVHDLAGQVALVKVDDEALLALHKLKNLLFQGDLKDRAVALGNPLLALLRLLFELLQAFGAQRLQIILIQSIELLDLCVYLLF